VLVVVLNKIFFRPVTRIMDQREGMIQENKNSCSRTMESYEKRLQEIDKVLKEAKAASDKIREDLETEALKEKARLVSEVSSESKARIEKAGAKLKKEMEKLKKELESETEGLARRIEQRLLN
jgi:F-type H+-transporting ATPase subunit b